MSQLRHNVAGSSIDTEIHNETLLESLSVTEWLGKFSICIPTENSVFSKSMNNLDQIQTLVSENH